MGTSAHYMWVGELKRKSLGCAIGQRVELFCWRDAPRRDLKKRLEFKFDLRQRQRIITLKSWFVKLRLNA